MVMTSRCADTGFSEPKIEIRKNNWPHLFFTIFILSERLILCHWIIKSDLTILGTKFWLKHIIWHTSHPITYRREETIKVLQWNNIVSSLLSVYLNMNMNFKKTWQVRNWFGEYFHWRFDKDHSTRTKIGERRRYCCWYCFCESKAHFISVVTIVLVRFKFYPHGF